MREQDGAARADRPRRFGDQAVVRVGISRIDGVPRALHQDAAQGRVAAVRRLHLGELPLHGADGILEGRQHDEVAADVERTFEHCLVRLQNRHRARFGGSLYGGPESGAAIENTVDAALGRVFGHADDPLR